MLLVVVEVGWVADVQLVMQQAEMSECMHCSLGGGIAKEFGQFAMAQPLRDISEEQILAIGDALAAKCGVEVGLGCGLGGVH